MKTWDVVIIGGGIIGVSLALSLSKHGAEVLIVEKSEPGREASHAAAGMLACCEQTEPLRDLGIASARLYPEFLHEIEDESGDKIDYRRNGTICLSGKADQQYCADARLLDTAELSRLEPLLPSWGGDAFFLPEPCVDPRTLISGALKAAKHRGIQIASGSAVLRIEHGAASGLSVATAKTQFAAGVVVNCAGAWACQITAPVSVATKPVKGHMLSVIPAAKLTAHGPAAISGRVAEAAPISHVIRGADVYLVPRSDGRIVIGSTVEDAGYDKRVDPATIQRLHQAAANLVPLLGEAKIHEIWTGLRPGTPDGLPILGWTELDGYFVATGHFRDGILLAPITAHLMTQIIRGQSSDFDLTAFSPSRFA